MNALIDAALHRSRTVIMIFILILVSGVSAFIKIPKESAPDINIPILYVSITHTGISPDDSVRLLLRPMEQELQSVEGLKEMRATAYEGGANIILEFEAGFDSDAAMDDVREKVDLAKVDLPQESEEPEIHEVNFSLFPVISIALHGPVPERTLLKIAKDMQDSLESIPSVLEAKISGDREERVDLVINPEKIQSYGLQANEVSAFLSRSNALVAAGSLDTGYGRFSIKVPGLLENEADILDLPLKVEGDAVVRVRDIAHVLRTYKERESIARVNGESAVVLEVSKRIGENLIDTVAHVRQKVAEQQDFWPKTVQTSFMQDQSTEIENNLTDLQNNVITAVLLVMVVVVAALGLRSGLLVGVAIPGSFLMAILALSIAGLTVNMVVLFGLILAVGMLVDGAIVITEYADRKMAEGLDKKAAYALAAKRMAWPVIASTSTTLAAFLPLVFWTGVVGEFMKFLPYTLLATLIASLIMALIFVPTLGGLFGKPGATDPETMKAIAASEHGDVTQLKGITGLYARTLKFSLRHCVAILCASVALLIASQALYSHFGRGIEFFPEIEPEQAAVLIHSRGNLSIHEKDQITHEVESRILDLPYFKAVYSVTGEGAGGQEATEDTTGIINLQFTHWSTRPPATEILKEIIGRVQDIPGIYVEIQKKEEGPSSGKPIYVELSARDPSLLPSAVNHIRRGFQEIKELVDIEDSLPVPGIEWELKVDRAQALKFGIDIQAVGDVVRMVTNGLKISTFRPDDGDDEIDIIVRFPDSYRSLQQLDELYITTANGNVPISNFVNRTPHPRTGNINRVDRKRVVNVKADVEPGVLPNDKIIALTAWLAENPLHKQVNFTFKGEDEEQKKSQEFLANAFLVALFLIAIILVTQFNSFYSAFLILSAIIMSTIGVMLGLLLFDQPFGLIMSGIGVIALAGIVVNNNIVLIDTYDRLKHEYPDPMEAILRTGVQRLRPVMLTTITTILGLLPMMYQVNIDFVDRDIAVGAPSMQWWSQLSMAVVCGLAFATVLTLVVTPSALMAKAKLAQWWHQRHAQSAASTPPEKPAKEVPQK